MNAQPILTGPGDSYDWQQDEINERAALVESATADMIADPSYIDEWIGAEDIPELGEVLARLLSDGLPKRDKSEADDALFDALHASLETLRGRFESWASRPTFGSSPVDAYIESRREP